LKPLVCLQYLTGHTEPILDVISVDQRRIITISNTSIQLWICNVQLRTPTSKNKTGDDKVWKRTFSESRKMRKNPLIGSRQNSISSTMIPKIALTHSNTSLGSRLSSLIPIKERVDPNEKIVNITNIEELKEEDEVNLNLIIPWIKRFFTKINRYYIYGFNFLKTVIPSEIPCVILASGTNLIVKKGDKVYICNIYSQSIILEDGFLRIEAKGRTPGLFGSKLLFQIEEKIIYSSEWRKIVIHVTKHIELVHPLLIMSLNDIEKNFL